MNWSTIWMKFQNSSKLCRFTRTLELTEITNSFTGTWKAANGKVDTRNKVQHTKSGEYFGALNFLPSSKSGNSQQCSKKAFETKSKVFLKDGRSRHQKLSGFCRQQLIGLPIWVCFLKNYEICSYKDSNFWINLNVFLRRFSWTEICDFVIIRYANA